MAELAMEESDDSIEQSLAEELATLSADLDRREFALRLSGEHDERNALVALKQGAGGVDAQDWVAMLVRMYVRWAEMQGFNAQIVDSSPGEEAGLKSATIQIEGRYAYGYLRSEKGVHRLVRLSPFNADNLRQTSFALVEVLPESDDVADVSINPDDLRIDVFRASGHGGQNVQKNSSAVRLTHIPSGLVVSVQNERSQTQNKTIAMSILLARLMDLEVQRQAEERTKLRGAHVAPEGGRQVRSYVLHPYKMVKDHRSDFETSDADKILNGEIQEMLKAYLLVAATE